MVSQLREFSEEMRGGESGYILVTVLVIMLLLLVLGFAATTTTTVEVQIAGNEKVNKQTFYEADGGTNIGAEVLEQNICCPTGFTSNDALGTVMDGGSVVVASDALSLWQQTPGAPPDDGDRDIFFPKDYGTDPHTNINVGGNTTLSSGNALQMAAGYEGKGKAAAAGGARIVYDIYAQRLGPINSRSIIQLQWQHVIGLEGDCNY